jgi:hypothetical protein
MNRHFYAFGSICRGESDAGSDIDLLACIDEPDARLDPKVYSIYTHARLADLWREGNPFAWHLHLESRLLYASDGRDFLAGLGPPDPYLRRRDDCSKFRRLFAEASDALLTSNNSPVFHLSCIFLATRNFATCYSLATKNPVFSRNSPLLIDPVLPIDRRAFEILTRARILSTRGYGLGLTEAEIGMATRSLSDISKWMDSLLGDLR